MKTEITPDRLSQISTMWTVLARAHVGETDEEKKLLSEMIERYQEAAFRYLTAATGNPEMAAELFQEFAVRFLRGDFRRVSQERGRFRDYLRASLINLVRRPPVSVRSTQNAGSDLQEVADTADHFEMAEDEAFLANWRESLLDRAWAGMESAERAGGPPYHTLLRMKADLPDVTSEDLAVELGKKLQSPGAFSEAGVRKLLQRGRELFTDLLVKEVANSVPTRNPDLISEELIELGFYSFCRKAVERFTP